MAELRAVGLVNVNDLKTGSGSPEKQIALDERFRWFLGEDFASVRNLPPYYFNSRKKKEEGLGGLFFDTYSLPLYYSENAYPVRDKEDIYEEYKRNFSY